MFNNSKRKKLKLLVIIYLVLTMMITSEVFAQSKKVLFIGNSYTEWNNLPGITANMALSVADTFTYDFHTPGGANFVDHALSQVVENKINAEDWDFVFLQGQSIEVSLSEEYVAQNVAPFAESLCNKIRDSHSCSQPVFYRTWGRRDGLNPCGAYPWNCTYEGMDDALKMNYQNLANSNEALVAPVGSVWRKIRTLHPSIELYSSDGSHPSPAGSYAAACSFYTSIFRKDPTLITFNSGLDSITASQIREATKLVVYDSLTNWNIGKYDLRADFSYTQLDDLSFQFFSNGENSTGQVWNIGDIVDTSANPVINFPIAGVYTVELNLFNLCDTLVFQEEINTVASNTTTAAPISIDIYPNPAKDEIILSVDDLEGIRVNWYDYNGEHLYTIKNLRTNILDTSNLANGLYLLELIKDGKRITKKITIFR